MLKEQIVNIINDNLKNPIYKTIKLMKLQTILSQSGFVKKEGTPAYIVVLHFVYMLVMNKKISTFIKQSDDALKKDAYYDLLKNPNYNWRKLLGLSMKKIMMLIYKVQDPKSIKVLVLDDTVEPKAGKCVEGSKDKLWSNKEKRCIRGLSVVSLNYSDGISSFMLDFAINMGNYAKVAVENFTNKIDHRSAAYKRQQEIMLGKSKLALQMIKRALKQGIYADYLLVDSWYSKPVFLKEVEEMGLKTISRMANNNSIWNFIGKRKTLNGIYEKFKKVTDKKIGKYGKIEFKYFSTIVEHKKAGKLKIVFIKTNKDKLIPIVSTNLELKDDEIIEIYKRRWDIEQGYKELRAHFGFGSEENRIYEAIIARITLSFFAYNIVSYINRMSHEPKTIGGLFAELECELTTLAIGMQSFIRILTEIAKVSDIVNRNEDLIQIIELLGDMSQKILGFRSES
jgi:hypothetical protein